MTYKVADGHDVALANLNDVTPQPKTHGIQSTRRTHAADGTVYDEGQFVELEFGMIESVSDYQTMLSQFGVQTATTNEVTIYVRDETFAWVRKNGSAVRPRPGKDIKWDFFPSKITLLIRDLEDAS